MCWHQGTLLQRALLLILVVMSVGHSSGGDYPAGQAWQQWSQVRPSAPHAGIVHQGQVVPPQAMYPVQPVYAGGMAVPQYGYMPQQPMYHQSLGTYAGNSSEYSGSGGAYAPSAREYQQTQARLDYNCQVTSAVFPCAGPASACCNVGAENESMKYFKDAAMACVIMRGRNSQQVGNPTTQLQYAVRRTAAINSMSGPGTDLSAVGTRAGVRDNSSRPGLL